MIKDKNSDMGKDKDQNQIKAANRAKSPQKCKK